jgi:hypothetical protein
MTNTSQQAGLPRQEQAIRVKRFHPSGTFVEFKKQDRAIDAGALGAVRLTSVEELKL